MIASRLCAALVCGGALLAAVGCRTSGAGTAPPLVQPGAPGEPSRVIAAGEAADLSNIRHTEADVRFMQDMLVHHAQALEMTALAPARTARDGIRLLARRIEVSQLDEIEMIRAWLGARGREVPALHDHGPAGHAMPGMLTPAEMTRLSASREDEFDKLFLEFMIRHHEGALAMVDALFAAPGAGQESDVFAFASDVDADQRMEIARMRALLGPPGPDRP